jgi:hypothetical protein
MELIRTKRKAIFLSLFFFSALGCWLLFSCFDHGQTQKNLLDKDTVKMQVSYAQPKANP